MKKWTLLCLCLLLTAALALPVMADELSVVFTTDSRYATGGTLTVDIDAMAEMDPRIREALQENLVIYRWYVSGVEVTDQTGKSIQLKNEYGNKFLHVEVICGSLTVTSSKMLITKIYVVGGSSTTATTTKATTATTTKATTTKATTVTTIAATTASTTQPTTVAATPAPTVAPVTEASTVLLQGRSVPEPNTEAQTTAVPTTTAAANSPAEMKQETAQPQFPLWGIAIVALGAVALIIIIAAIVKKKK